MPDALLSLLDAPATRFAFWFAETFGPAVLAFAGGALGTSQGLKAFRSSSAWENAEAREYQRWKRRTKLGVPAGDRQPTKDYLNALTARLAANELGDFSSQEPLSGMPKSVVNAIQDRGDAESRETLGSIEQTASHLISLRQRGVDSNTHDYVKTFAELKLSVARLIDLVFEKALTTSEIRDLAAMGIVPRDQVSGHTNTFRGGIPTGRTILRRE